MFKRPWPIVVAVYVALTLVYARTLLPVMGSALPNDAGDPGLNSWILWWNAQAVPLTTAWWNGPIFFPSDGSMALSETLLNLWPLSAPLHWAGASAILVYNIAFLLSFPAAALGAHALARALTGRHDAGFVSGLAYGFAPYRAAQIPHLQLLWSCWMPLALLALHRFVETRRRRYLLLFGGCWIMNGLATGYYLFFFAVLVGLWALWFGRGLRDWIPIGVAALLASAALAPLLLGYRHYQSAFGLARSPGEISYYSADLSAVWAANAYVWPHLWTIEPRPEGELYPGITIVALALAGAVLSWRTAARSRRYGLQRWLAAGAAFIGVLTMHAWLVGGWSFRLAGIGVSLNHPERAVFLALSLAVLAVAWDARIASAWRRRSALLFYAVASVLMLLFALGPDARLFGTAFMVDAPYAWLRELPGGDALRVPARFGMLFALCLAIGGALAVARLKPRRAIAAAVCLAVLAEGFVWRLGIAPAPPPLGVGGLDRGSVLLEVPIVDTFSETAAMLRATRTGYTLVNGFSGYLPLSYQVLRDSLADGDRSVLEALQDVGALMVFVHKARDPEGRYRTLVAGVPGAQLVASSDEGTLYKLPARRSAARTAPPPVPIAGIHASVNDDLARNAVDGDLETEWTTGRSQFEGDQLRISLERPSVVARIDLALGSSPHAYPQQIRVEVLAEDGSTHVVWQGPGAGPTFTSALEEPSRLATRLVLMPPVRGRDIVLTLLTPRAAEPWTVAEINVLGE